MSDNIQKGALRDRMTVIRGFIIDVERRRKRRKRRRGNMKSIRLIIL
jgi:hypothetical protein